MEAGYFNSLEINFIGKIVPDTSIQPYGPDLGSFSVLLGRICSGSSAPVLADMVRPACGSDLANRSGTNQVPSFHRYVGQMNMSGSGHYRPTDIWTRAP